ncbi:MAG: hypothetical protein KDD51_06385 [Bdellovibrionales bacterium]|nr:hypothetical protein [Bdellovibrionales bacterium]
MSRFFCLILLVSAAVQAVPLKVRVSCDGRLPYDPDTKGFAQISFQNAVLGRLLRLNDQHQMVPVLLEQAYWDYGAKAYVLRLPARLTFSNGSAVAEDLDFSLTRFFLTTGRADPIAFLRGIVGVEALKKGAAYTPWQVAGITKVDERTVSVRLKDRDPSFMFGLTLGWVSLVPKEALAEDYVTWKNHPVGAGPYVVVSGCGKSCLRLKAHAGSGFSGPETVEFVSDPQVQVDVVGFTPSPTGQYEKIFGEGPVGFTGIFFNYESPLAKDPNFRKALALSIDRAGLVNGEFGITPLYEILTSNFIGRVKLTELQQVEETKRLLAQVPKELLAQPLRAFGFSARAEVTGFEAAVLDRLRTQWKAAGLRVEFARSTDPLFAVNDRDTVFRVDERGTGFADPLPVFYAFYSGYLARLFPKSEFQFGKLLAAASAASGLGEKAQRVQAISRYFLENRYAVPLYEKRLAFWVRPGRITSLGKQQGVGLDVTTVRVAAAGKSERSE